VFDGANWLKLGLSQAVSANVAFSDLTSTPTTLAGYGITDAPSVLTDLSITDGTSGQVLTTDGSAGFTFTSASSSTTFNAIGTYCLGFYTGLGIHNGGATFSGSSIATANTYAGTSGWSGSSTSTLSGTWRLMGNIGYYNQATTASNANVSGSLFVRIS
jgi:hypothetical protein